MRSNNPVFNSTNVDYASANVKSVSRQGIFLKTLLGLLVMVVSLNVTTQVTALRELANSWVFFLVFLVGFIAMVRRINQDPKVAKRAFFFYAIAEGMMLASLIINVNILSVQYGLGIGLATQAFMIVIMFFFLMLFIYTSFPNVINKLAPMFMVALIFFFAITMLDLVFRIFGGMLINPTSNFGLFMSIGLVLLAAFSYTMDFRQADYLVNTNAPKEYEYVAALGLLTTTVWLFVEVLRLLMILMARNND